MKLRRFVAAFGLSLLCLAGLAAQSVEPYWLKLERGKQFFRNGDYSDALLLFEDARRDRADLFADRRSVLIAALSRSDVRRLGDDLDLIESLLVEAKATDASDALDFLFGYVPRLDLHNSAAAALEALKTYSAYPEAEYWIGLVYAEEGETGIAVKQLDKAYSLRALLETPGEARDILYRLADLRRLRGDYAGMEADLIAAIADDELWGADGQAFLRGAMADTLRQDGVDRFLELYRYDRRELLEAHRRLGLWYSRSGRYERALGHLSFAVLIAGTAVIGELGRQDHNWLYLSFYDAFATAARNSAIADWLARTDFYRTAYYLGMTLFALGNRTSADGLWRAVAASPTAGEWSSRASKQLAAPFIEAPTEEP